MSLVFDFDISKLEVFSQVRIRTTLQFAGVSKTIDWRPKDIGEGGSFHFLFGDWLEAKLLELSFGEDRWKNNQEWLIRVHNGGRGDKVLPDFYEYVIGQIKGQIGNLLLSSN
ncbi:MAG: hypothetical protein WCX70_00325 [Candidatus Paceibacterota bacterium]|jgi:hypothetical protein